MAEPSGSGSRANRTRRGPPLAPDPEMEVMARTFDPGTIVRDAAPEDGSAVAGIGRVAVPQTYNSLISDASVVEAIVEQSYALDALGECIARSARADDAHFLVAERGGRVVGFLHFDCEGPDPELHRIYVDPAQKRQGLGGALLRELHRRLLPGTSYILMVVAANRPAVSFYERHGFVEAARVDGVAYMQERMGVEFPAGRQQVPALILRFTKAESQGVSRVSSGSRRP